MFYDRLKTICDKKGLKVTPTVKAAGISAGNIASWKSGVEPKYLTLRKLADYLDVPIEALTGEEIPERNAADRIESAELVEYLDQLRERPEMRMLFSVAKDANKKDIEAIVRFIESLNER